MLGAVAGWIGSIDDTAARGEPARMLINKTGKEVFLDSPPGYRGRPRRRVRVHRITGFNIWSLFVAVEGAVVVLALYHALTRRTTP